MYLKTDDYTRVCFANKIPTGVRWEVSRLREPTNEELIRDVTYALARCGWKVQVGKPHFEDDDPCSDLVATITVYPN